MLTVYYFIFLSGVPHLSLIYSSYDPCRTYKLIVNLVWTVKSILFTIPHASFLIKSATFQNIHLFRELLIYTYHELKSIHMFNARVHCKWSTGKNAIWMSGSDLCIPKNETVLPCYFQNKIIMFCFPIFTFMYLWAICLFCCSQRGRLILGIYKLPTDTGM